MRTALVFFIFLTTSVRPAHAQWWGFGGPGDLSGRGYTRGEARAVATVQEATVVAVRRVRLEASSQARATGALLGGALGGVAGSEVGRGKGSFLAALVGGVAGAAIGDAAAEKVAESRGLEITVRLSDGRIVAVTQADDGEEFFPGDKVALVTSGQGTRVAHRGW